MSPFLLTLMLVAVTPQDSWLQWGGPSRDFQLPSAKVAAWPESGPRQLWERKLGDGYSSIVTDGQTLYTLFRRGNGTVVVALAAGTGKTVWEQVFEETPNDKEKPEMDPVHGNAPSSTPVIVGDRLFTVTFLGRLVALDRATGRVIWSSELWRKYGGTIVGYGYTNSPLVYKDTIILPVGGSGHAMMAFRQKDGSVAWAKGDSDNAMSSPMLISVDGENQVVVVMLKEVLAVSPDSGDVLWRYPHANKTETNVTSPVWCPGNILLVSSAYDSGTRALQLKREGGKTTPTELWFNRKMRVHMTNILPLGDYFYAANGDFGSVPSAAAKISTGEIVWQDRAFIRANFLRVGEQVLVLDEEGKIGLVTLSPEGMKVVSLWKSPLVSPAWTPPTLSGKSLFIRDRASIVAYSLGS